MLIPGALVKPIDFNSLSVGDAVLCDGLYGDRAFHLRGFDVGDVGRDRLLYPDEAFTVAIEAKIKPHTHGCMWVVF